MQNKSVRIKVKIIKKIHSSNTQYTMYYERVHSILNTEKKLIPFSIDLSIE
jgi:hypothetical protein